MLSRTLAGIILFCQPKKICEINFANRGLVACHKKKQVLVRITVSRITMKFDRGSIIFTLYGVISVGIIILGVIMIVNNRAVPSMPDIVWIFYDAGETFAHIPVLELLTQDKQYLPGSFQVLSMQTSARVLQGRTYVLNLEDDWLSIPINSTRHYSLPQEIIDRIVARFVPRRAVVVGMASAIQRQLALAYKAKGIMVFVIDCHFI